MMKKYYKICEQLQELFPRYIKNNQYQNKKKDIDSILSNDRGNALEQLDNLVELSYNNMDIFGILASYDLYMEIRRYNH